MSFSDLTTSGEAETRCFISALKDIFSGEAWKDIAPYAERAWNACYMGHDWREVEPRVHQEWKVRPS